MSVHPPSPGTAAVPSGVNNHITTTTATEDAQSSLLRLTRRHSLPTSATLTHFLSLWNSEEGRRPTAGDQHCLTPASKTLASAPQTVQSSQTLTHRSTSLPVSGDRNGGQVAATGNRHRYGHRHTRSAAVVDQPVIVRQYNPGAANAAMGSTVREVGTPPFPFLFRLLTMGLWNQDDELEKVPLPPIDAFSFDGILKTIEPQVNQALDSVSKLCCRYQDSLQSEVDLLAETQSTIDSQMRQADVLATSVLKTTKARTDRLEADTAGLKGGAAVEVVAEAAEATHTFITSIITTLLAIDEMLPPPDRLSPTHSPHRKHYPRLHTLLNDKSTELNIRFGSARLFAPQDSPDQSRPTTAPLGGMSFGESSAAAAAAAAGPAKTETWVLGRRMSITSSRTVTSFSHTRRISSPPQLQLRTLLPTCPTEDVTNGTASSQGSIFPLPAQTETGISTTPVSTNAESKRDENRRASTSTLTYFPKEEKVERGLWKRNASSWSIGFWREERKESVEERLRRMLESDVKVKGKGKGRLV